MSTASMALRKTSRETDIDSYESLPPNFSLAANMAAGAFAGIAVWLTRCDDSEMMLIRRQEHSVMYPIDLLKVCGGLRNNSQRRLS